MLWISLNTVKVKVVNCKICDLSTTITTDKDVYFCKSCKHFMYAPKGNIESLEFNHEILSDSLSNLRSKNATLIYKKFKTLTSLYKNYVEVGAGKGYLIEKFLEDSISCTAIDMDDTFRDYLIDKGIHFEKMIDTSITELNSYDCFLSSHFLEHIQEPKSFLKMLKSSKVEYLIVEIPTNDGLIFKISHFFQFLSFHDFCDRLFQKSSNSPHFQYFSDKSFKLLLHSNSYKVVDSMKLQFVDKLPNFKRIRATESSILSSLVAIVLPAIDLLNRLTGRADSTVYFAKLNSESFND